LAVLFGVLIVDQTSKAVVRGALAPSESLALVSDVFHLTHVRNAGAAFGLMPGQRELFVMTSTIVIGAIAVYWLWQRPKARWLVRALGLVAGGAMGNLIDRVSLGRVTDFLDFRWFPVFNLADSAIVIGVGLLVLWILFGPEAGESRAGHASVAEEPRGE